MAASVQGVPGATTVLASIGDLPAQATTALTRGLPPAISGACGALPPGFHRRAAGIGGAQKRTPPPPLS